MYKVHFPLNENYKVFSFNLPLNIYSASTPPHHLFHSIFVIMKFQCEILGCKTVHCVKRVCLISVKTKHGCWTIKSFIVPTTRNAKKIIFFECYSSLSKVLVDKKDLIEFYFFCFLFWECEGTIISIPTLRRY